MDSQVQITFLIQHLCCGGAEKRSLVTAQLLSRQGFKCSFLTLGYSTPHPRIERLTQEAVALGVEVLRPRTECRLSLRQVVRTLQAVRGRGRRVLWTWGARADVVGLVCASLAPRARLIRALASAHADRIKRERWIGRLLHRRVNLYLSNSWRNCELLAAAVPGVLRRTRVVYNPLSEEELAEPPVVLPARPERLEVVMLGNIRYQIKGYDLVVELARRIKRERLPIHFMIAGRGDDAAVLLADIRNGGLEEVIAYVGEVPRPYEFLRQGNVYLLTSRLEGMPNGLLEAMNLGLPCIATRVGDVGRFAQDGVHLRVVEVNDPEGILGALKEYLADYETARRLARAGRELCHESLSPAKIGPRLAQAVRDLFESTASPAS